MKNLQRVVIIFIFIAVVVATYGLELRGRYVVPIMTYHSISADGTPESMNSVTKRNFDYQMAFLKRNKYHVISLDELTSAIKEKRLLPRNSVVLTIDDGYADNYENAFPILRHYGFTATIFIASNFIGKSGYLTWPQIKEMDASGFSFGSHTLSHRYLPDLSDEEQKWEISMSKEVIESHLGHPINNFCYRTGGFNDSIKEQVRKAGYRSACTTNRGYNRLNHDVYELKRIRFSNSDKTPLILWVKLSGYYNLFRKPVNPN